MGPSAVLVSDPGVRRAPCWLRGLVCSSVPCFHTARSGSLETAARCRQSSCQRGARTRGRPVAEAPERGGAYLGASSPSCVAATAHVSGGLGTCRRGLCLAGSPFSTQAAGQQFRGPSLFCSGPHVSFKIVPGILGLAFVSFLGARAKGKSKPFFSTQDPLFELSLKDSLWRLSPDSPRGT